MHDARDLAARFGAHGNHEAAVAESDNLFLNRFGLSAHHRLQRTVDPAPPVLHFPPDPQQPRTGAVVHFAVGENLAGYGGVQTAEIGNVRCHRRELGIALSNFGAGQSDAQIPANGHEALKQQDLLRLEAGCFDLQLREGCVGILNP